MTDDATPARKLYEDLTDDLLYDPAVGRSTITGQPCVRRAGRSFASFHPRADRRWDTTGIDRDPEAVQQARATVPEGDFSMLDQRDLGQLDGPFGAAVILWQSFGYFDADGNDGALTAIAELLRPGGRLLLDLFHPGYFETRQGRTTQVRDPRCRATTNRLAGARLTSTIEYADGAIEPMDWELFTPDGLAGRAASAGFRELERCCWWDETRPPDAAEQRHQIVLERPRH